MTIITLTDCPPALRGDLSKWLLEINTGVYVGQVNARVRDKLWERVTANIKNGRATMVCDALNEQGMDFRIHNTSWEVVDFDGLKLVRRPSEQRMLERRDEEPETIRQQGFSNAARQLMLRRVASAGGTNAKGKLRKGCLPDCSVVDIETTGLEPKKDEIIEIAALRVRDLKTVETFHAIIHAERPLPTDIVSLTGLNDEILEKQGLPAKEALRQFVEFIGSDTLLIHNASFDLAFLRESFSQFAMPPLRNRVMDSCILARKAFLQVADYRLSTLANHFGFNPSVQHRALADCETLLQVYRKIAQTE